MGKPYARKKIGKTPMGLGKGKKTRVGTTWLMEWKGKDKGEMEEGKEA